MAVFEAILILSLQALAVGGIAYLLFRYVVNPVWERALADRVEQKRKLLERKKAELALLQEELKVDAELRKVDDELMDRLANTDPLRQKTEGQAN